MKLRITIITLLTCQILSSQEINRDQLKKEIKEELKIELQKKQEKNRGILNKFQLKGYGVINYYNYNWDTDLEKRNTVDAERLNLYLNYNFSSKIALKKEFEFEHGGTGVTKELDKLEEFGEFETEVEKGGEVKLEQVYINFNINKYLLSY